MRIGLFTDTYRPSINGIVFVVETLKKRLEEEGHEVFIFCPAKTMRPSRDLDFPDDEDHIVRFPSIKGAFFDDYDTSIFFPPRVVQQIRDLELDVVHVFTPSQVGLVGIQAAWKNDTPFIMQHSTDLYEFVEHYPIVLPGILALIGIVLPFTVRLQGRDMREILKLYRPRRGVTEWNRDIIERAITIVYSKADAVIALSRKSADQLQSWQHHEQYEYGITMMPNGVDAIPKPSVADLKKFKALHGIDDGDEVFGFVGRLAAEKNLDLLIDAAEKVIKERPKAKLVLVGDFEYRESLERHASDTSVADRIVFTGALQREELGVAYASLDVFVFPSLKDTQGWVLHEAAHAGLPIVLIDKKLSEVAVNKENALYAKNNPTDLARQILILLSDSSVRDSYGNASRKIARKFGEKSQIKSLIGLYEDIIEAHIPRPESKLRLRRRRKASEVEL
ncbi:glycosyltransferase [Candidatus Nomurabacteria bacterium]|nr:glycosyltransferase [Candidatus Nomurabacteria bacterium]